MKRVITQALRSREAKQLLSRGLRFSSTPKQVENGTLAFVGKIKRKNVNFKITSCGAVLSNEYVARRVMGETENQMYREGLRAAIELLDKRFGA